MKFGSVCLLALLSVLALGQRERAPTERITVGVNSDYPPYEFLGPNHRATGFDVDVVRESAKEVYLDVDFVQGPWSEVRAKMEGGEIDLLAGMLYSADRARRVTFGESYLTVEYSIFVRKGTSGIHAFEDLAGKEVLVEQDSQMHELLKEKSIGKPLLAKSEPDALVRLAKGEGQAALVPLLSGLSLLRDRQIDGVEPVGGPLFPRDLCFATHKGNTNLISRLNTGLAIIRRNGRYDSIYRKWFGSPESEDSLWPTIFHNIGIALAATGVLVTIGGIWVVVLRRQVRHQTAELRSSEEKYRTWVEFASDGIFVADDNMNFIDVNAAACSLTGYSREELLGKPATMLLEPKHKEESPVSFAPLDSGLSIVRERPFRRKDGTIFVAEIHAKRIGQGLYQGIVRDITARKSAEEQLRRMNEELETRVEERTRELQSAYNQLESFSYSVAHDLRAPLRAMNGYAAMIRRDFAEGVPEDAKAYLDRIVANTQRMAQLIDSLLAYARTNRMDIQPREVSMEDIAHETWNDLYALRGDVDVKLDVLPMPSAYGDPTLLKLLYTNLFDNGVKFAKTGGGAHIEVGYDEEAHAYFVRDNGVGFDPKYKAKLFRVFERLHGSDYEGTGVGLAIVRRIAEQHRGQVWADGLLGEGATFWFSLDTPRKNDESA